MPNASDAPLIRLVDDDAGFLEAAAFFLETKGWRTAKYAGGAGFLRGDAPSAPGVLVFDLMMPGMDGMELLAAARGRGWEQPVIFLTAHGTVPAAVEALRAGAFHFLQKPVGDAALQRAVAEAWAQARSQPPAPALPPTAAERVAQLSPRELQVARLLAAGLNNREAAERLGLSKRTVEVYHAFVYRKLGVASVEAVAGMLSGAGG
ncbi:MAG: response regulator transcription factor [Duodenibacillus sp.]|nr:response regulator transcription factor [Duodenibacillus sp.]